MRRVAFTCLPVVLGTLFWLGSGATAQAQYNPLQPQPRTTLPQYWYYPYYYFPHNYWPTMGPRWPEAPGQPYMPPPAYMAYPPFMEPHWRYEFFKPQRFYRGSHFWLDQF